MISFLFVERRWSDFSSAFLSESTVGAFKKDLVYVSQLGFCRFRALIGVGVCAFAFAYSYFTSSYAERYPSLILLSPLLSWDNTSWCWASSKRRCPCFTPCAIARRLDVDGPLFIWYKAISPYSFHQVSRMNESQEMVMSSLPLGGVQLLHPRPLVVRVVVQPHLLLLNYYHVCCG